MSLAEPFGSPGPVLGFSPLGMNQRGYFGRRVHTLLFLCLSEDPPLSSALTPRKLGKRPVSRGSTGPPRRGRLWLCLPHNPHLSWNPRDSSPSGLQGPRAMPHWESQETTRPRPNATALTGKLRPRERGHSLCPLGPQRPLRAPAGEARPVWRLPLRAAWRAGPQLRPSLASPGGEDRWSRVMSRPAGGPEFALRPPALGPWENLAGTCPGAQAAQGLENVGPMFSPSRHQWLRLPTLHRGH